MIPRKIIIRGAGDLATGVAHRLWKSGFSVILIELPEPLVVRKTVSFASAVYEGSITVEDVTAKLCSRFEQIDQYLDQNTIPVLVDPLGKILSEGKPTVLIDAVMAKNNTLTRIDHAELVIGLGPGFFAGKDVDVVVETKRGHNLGKVVHSGRAARNTGEPGMIAGYSSERLLRAPHSGCFKPVKDIGDIVKKDQTVAQVNSNEIKASIDGMIRGMLHHGIQVQKGTKVGDIDPRGTKIDYHAISDKARAVGGGVLEAILNRFF
ncbi:MAG: selenium-dependent molybdenum cofactor biosynthesis protein YqeB [Bacillota bacterium]